MKYYSKINIFHVCTQLTQWLKRLYSYTSCTCTPHHIELDQLNFSFYIFKLSGRKNAVVMSIILYEHYHYNVQLFATEKLNMQKGNLLKIYHSSFGTTLKCFKKTPATHNVSFLYRNTFKYMYVYRIIGYCHRSRHLNRYLISAENPYCMYITFRCEEFLSYSQHSFVFHIFRFFYFSFVGFM